MRSRREQVRAYRFVTRRIVSGLVSGEPENPDQPLRRTGLAMFASIMVGSLVFAGFAIFGLVVPGGSTKWMNEKAIIIEKETGTKYLYRTGKLWPVLNYTSARLYLQDANPDRVSASRRSLAGTARGLPIGIPDAPDSLPDAKHLVGLPWSVCGTRADTNAQEPIAGLTAGEEYPGGHQLGAEGVLVETADRDLHALWNGHRLAVPGEAERSVLQWGDDQPVPVDPAFLDAVPAGPQLAAPDIDGFGDPGKSVAGRSRTIGTVFVNGTEYHVLTRDGLTPTFPLIARLLEETKRAPKVQISATDLANAPKDPDERRLRPAGFPPETPKLSQPAGPDVPAVCVVHHGAERPDVVLYPKAPAKLREKPADEGRVSDRLGNRLADRVLLRPGGGALVRGNETYLVTDLGYKYKIVGDGTAGFLGYPGVRAVAIPEELLALIPSGPTLDPEQIRVVSQPDGAGPSPSGGG